MFFKTSHFWKIYNENTKGSGKKRLISINNAAVIVNQTKATTGAVDKYVVKFFIKNFCLLLFQIFFFSKKKIFFSDFVLFFRLEKRKKESRKKRKNKKNFFFLFF